MIRAEGNLRKMTAHADIPVHYSLEFHDIAIDMNELINKEITFRYADQINCMKCGTVTKKSYGQGYCYPCFISIPETEECVMRPELCRAHEGIARDIDFATNHCLIEHVVYLANSSGLKVGVTRYTQIPTRWLDQGATQAIKVATTPNRYTAGLIEVALKNVFADKTNWRKMLTNDLGETIDLLEQKGMAEEVLPFDLRQYISDDDTLYTFDYPVVEYPEKVKSMTFDKMPEITGILKGIKGQYLIFDDNRVINIRKHNGYKVEINIE